MSDQMNQESIQQSFPSISIPGSINNNGKEENITSSINSLLNNNHESIPLTATNNPSIGDETTPVTKKRSRRTGRPIRNKIVKESSIKNEPYTIPYSTRSQTQQLRQQASTVTENFKLFNHFPTTERKKHCSKFTDEISQVIHPSSLATRNKTFNSLDFSRMTISDLQIW
ncbi:unnamed protein product [Rhizophagus irregularis]|nr:unnamed protein product [Rhizophagus irregularis]